MKLSKETRKFYLKLGNLFYAIAAVDKVVREEEVQTLKNIIKDEWVFVDDETDEFGVDSAYQIEIVFDWLEELQPDPEDCFNSFKKFKQEHEAMFPQHIKDLIWKTADRIAASFSGKNKSEVILLAKLKSVLLD